MCLFAQGELFGDDTLRPQLRSPTSLAVSADDRTAEALPPVPQTTAALRRELGEGGVPILTAVALGAAAGFPNLVRPPGDFFVRDSFLSSD